MLRVFFSLLLLLSVFWTPFALGDLSWADSEDAAESFIEEWRSRRQGGHGRILIPLSWKKCSSDQDCTKVATLCSRCCISEPINKENINKYESLFREQCGDSKGAMYEDSKGAMYDCIVWSLELKCIDFECQEIQKRMY